MERSATGAFEGLRPLLFTIAYEILGTAADAEDVVQDSYIRWRGASDTDVIHPRAYLVQTVTRQALNHLRTVQRRREDYIGVWLPEPVRTEPDAGHDAVLAESVSIAMLLVLESLGATERAVFVLAEVFGYGYAEIAEIVGKSDTAVRQIAYRAREHVRARRKRFDPDADTTGRVVERFLWATHTGDVDALMAVLAPEVVHVSDGGGRVSAALHPVSGAGRVAHFLIGVGRKGLRDMEIEIVHCNALPAVMFRSKGRLDSLLILEVDHDRVAALYAVRNPDKLSAASTPRALTREKDIEWKL